MTFERASLVPTLALTTCILGGCALGKSYSQIDPEGALADIRKHNGYHAMESVSPGKVKVVFRSEGAGVLVGIASSTAAASCEGFSKPEPIRDAGHGVIYPWIADLTMANSNAKGFIEKEFEPAESLQVQGSASVLPSTGHSFQRCGLVTSRFKPEANRIYLVNFLWEGKTCRHEISDATNRDSPQPISFEPVLGCKR